jgi:hypothetical protein
MNMKFKFAFAMVLVGALAACGPQKHDNNQNGQNPQAMNGGATSTTTEQHPIGKRILADCGQDLQQFCTGADKPRRCLRQNYDKLSSVCKARLDLLKARRQERMQQQQTNGAKPAGTTTPKPQDDDDND